MTFKEKFDNEPLWYKKCIILEIFHLVKVSKNNKWRVKDTARIMKISIGQTSECLQLAKAVQLNSSLQKYSRNKALKVMRDG